MPTVAILSAYHNRAAAVEATFRSIAAQTFTDFEALIWDDCSSDDTWKEMQRVVAELDDSRFKIFRHEPNVGLTRGLNDAISRTTAEYIAILGSGDTCHPSRIEKQVAALQGDQSAVFCATASTTYDPIQKKTFFDSDFHGSVLQRDDIRTHCPFTHGSVMYRASALHQAGEYEIAFKWCADWDMFFRILELGHAVYLNEVLYFRVAQVDGVSFSPKKAFDQTNCKHLALKLSTASERERTEILQTVREKGIDAALENERAEIVRDLARRNAKLYLMGRTEAGDEMLALAKSAKGSYSPKYRLALPLARLLGNLPIDTNILLRSARALPK